MADDLGTGVSVRSTFAPTESIEQALRQPPAGWRPPARLVGEVAAFARRRPAAFVTISAAIGFVLGRMIRAVTASPGEVRR